LQRLDAEAIRDGFLAVSGSLAFEMYGPPVAIKVSEDGDVIDVPSATGARRSIYLQQRRTQVVGMLEAFDAPSIVFNCTARNRTTVPLQSLKLLNSSFVRQQAESLAQRVHGMSPSSDDEKIQSAFRLAIGRPATTSELQASQGFLKTQALEYPDHSDPVAAAWIDFCQMLLASNAVLYLE